MLLALLYSQIVWSVRLFWNPLSILFISVKVKVFSARLIRFFRTVTRQHYYTHKTEAKEETKAREEFQFTGVRPAVLE